MVVTGKIDNILRMRKIKKNYIGQKILIHIKNGY